MRLDEVVVVTRLGGMELSGKQIPASHILGEDDNHGTASVSSGPRFLFSETGVLQVPGIRAVFECSCSRQSRARKLTLPVPPRQALDKLAIGFFFFFFFFFF
jgi:hypothetical protein